MLAIVTSCAQGSTDTDADGGAGVTVGTDGGQQGTDAGTAGEGGTTVNPAGDTGGGGPDPVADGGGSGNEDSGATDDAGEDTGIVGAPDAGGVDSGGGGTDAGSVVPTTCAQADQSAGCCVGNELYYCQSPTSSMTIKACTGGQVCGWDSKYYDCVAAPGGPDPTGTYPINCK